MLCRVHQPIVKRTNDQQNSRMANHSHRERVGYVEPNRESKSFLWAVRHTRIDSPSL